MRKGSRQSREGKVERDSVLFPKLVEPEQHRIIQHFNRPGKPVENACIGRFNGRVRAECLNLHRFQTFPQARLIVAAWHQDDNELRPHSSLEDHSPNEDARLKQAG